MANLRKSQKTFEKLLAQNEVIEIPAFLGDLNGLVKADNNGNVYVVLFNGEVATVRNGKVPPVPRLPVIIGRHQRDGTLRILRPRDAFAESAYIDIPNHADKNHTWPNVDVLWVRGEQLLPGLVIPSSGLTVQFFGFVYYLDGWHLLNNQEIDLTAQVPTSGAKYILAEVNNLGVVSFRAGSEVASREMLTPESIPIITVTKKPLFAIKMYVGQTSIIKSKLATDIVDLRFAGAASGGVATAIEWADILSVPTEFNPDTTVTDPLYIGRFLKTADPTVGDDVDLGYQKLDLWLNQSTGQSFVCLDNADGVAVWLPIGSSISDVVIKVDGALAVTTGAALPFLVTRDIVIDRWYIYAIENGSASSTIVDVNLNGTTVFTTQANRPTLAYDDANNWAFSGLPEFTEFIEGDVLSIDIDQIATSASDLVIVGVVSGAGVASSAFNLIVFDGVTTVEHVGEVVVDGGAVIDDGGGVARIVGLIASVNTIQTRTQATYTALTTGDGVVITELNIVMTPKKAGNKVILEWTINFEVPEDVVFTVKRNGTLLANSDDGSGNKWSGIAAVPYDNNNDSTPSNVTVKIIDENSLGVLSTYSVAVKASGAGSLGFFLNRAVGTPAQSFENMLSVAQAMEINT